jgi:hypothetical protein
VIHSFTKCANIFNIYPNYSKLTVLNSYLISSEFQDMGRSFAYARQHTGLLWHTAVRSSVHASYDNISHLFPLLLIGHVVTYIISWNYEYIIFGQIIFQNCYQFKAFVGLSDRRTVGLSDCRIIATAPFCSFVFSFFSEWVSECCLMPNEQFFSYLKTRTSYIYEMISPIVRQML